MNILCKLELHKWNGCICVRCGIKRHSCHEWQGCKCEKCGETRNAAHSWSGCICERCNARRDEEHEIEGCTCKVCGKEIHTTVLKGCCTQCGKSVVEYISMQWGPHSYDQEIISGRRVNRYYNIEDRKCYRCGISPHLITYDDSIGRTSKKSENCITCGNVYYCEKCRKYIPVLVDMDNFSGAWRATGHRCPKCKGFVSKR